ncbi:MAG: glycosyltransferase family 10, partial [Candidatus Liptonbacteria bacterium]|nr:glycosyltransferase family 10 [Candidatus Liptonbacteria bacterium]
MNLYVLTNSSHGLRDQFFDASSVRHHAVRAPNNIFWQEFGDALRRAGITPHTFDMWNKDVARPDDILVSMNHPGEPFLWRAMYYLKYFKQRGGHVLARNRFFYENYKYFSKRILLEIEPWVSQPYVFDRLDRIRDSGVYTKIILHCRGYGDSYGNFDYFRYWNKDITSHLFDAPKGKFLCIVNGNVTPHALWSRIGGKWYRELYGERLQAIRYFSEVPGFDLYGWRWDQMPRHPFYFYYGKYARKAWRGAPEDKTVAMAPYKFAICFENCEAPSWVTEKIYDCFSAGCIPVYYGAPDIAEIVPPECFIDFRKFAAGGARPADWP